MITSQQVNQMHMSSMQSHGMAQGMMPSQPMMGMSQYPPTFSYSMAGQQNPNERVGRRAAGAMVGAAQGALGVASVANLGLGVAGMAGLAATTGPVGWAGGLLAGGGIMAAQATVGGMAQGMKFGGQVNQMFGNQQFANASNPSGRGFDSKQLHQMYGAVRAIEKDDPFVNMKDALRVTEKFGSQFGIQQGVRDAEKLSARVTELGKTLSSMAKTMGTTIDEAGNIMGMSRGAGFYTAQDVMGNTQDFTFKRGRGFTSQQTGQIQGAGAAASRSIGLTGQSGARFASRMVDDLSIMEEMGAIDKNALMDMTGTTTMNDAAAAFSGRTQQLFQSTMSQGVGNAMMTALGKKDKSGRFTGEIDQSLLREMTSGSVDFESITRRGQRNASTGTARASFEENKDQILGNVMGSGEGVDALMSVIQVTAEKHDKSMQLVFKQITGGNAKEFRMLNDMYEKGEAARAERMKQMTLEAQMRSHQQNLRENHTIGGLTQQFVGGLKDTFVNPAQDAGANIAAGFGAGGEELRMGILKMRNAGTATFSTSKGAISGVEALMDQVDAATDAKGNIDYGALGAAGVSRDRADLVTGGSALRNTDRLTFAAASGRTGDLQSGLASHLKGTSAAGKAGNMSAQDKARIQTKISEANRERDPEKKAALLKQIREDVNSALNGRPPTSQDHVAAAHAHQVLDIPARESKDTLDAVIAEVGGELGLQVVQAGRSADLDLEKSNLYDQTVMTQDQLQDLFGTGGGRGDRVLKGAATGAGLGAYAGGVPGAVLGGIAGGIAGSLGGGGEIADLVAGGAGAALIGKATSGKKMKDIDTAIAASGGDDAAAAKKLSVALGIEVSADDVKVYRSVIDSKTGTSNAGERTLHSDGEGAYDKDYTDVFEMAGKANDSLEAEAAGKLFQSMKDLSTTLSQDLAGVEGMDEAALGLQNATGLTGYRKSMKDAVAAAAASGLTSDKLGDGASRQAQLVAKASEDVLKVKALDKGGQVNISELKKKLNIGKGTALSDKIKNLAGEDSTISTEDAMKLMSDAGGDNIAALARDGVGAMDTVLQSGMSPMEIQLKSAKESAESVRKNAEMIDAIYSRMSGTAPTNPDSSVAGFRTNIKSFRENPDEN